MFAAIAGAIPLPWFDPFRAGCARLRRGSLGRNICVAVLQAAQKPHRLAGCIPEIRPMDAPHLSFEASDSMVTDAVYWFGVRGYEGMVADVWAGLCRQSRSVIEIGGNVGLFTTIGARATAGTYTVVEPVPAIAAILRANLRRNGVDKVEVLEAAVIPSGPAREVILNIPDEGRGAPVGSHLVEGVEVVGRSTLRQISVRGLPVAELLAGRDLIKIDAEGIEAELLTAGRDIILANRPALLIEILPEASLLGAMLAALAEEAGYTISIIPEYGLDGIVTVAPAEFSSALPQRYNSKDVVLSAGGPLVTRVDRY